MRIVRINKANFSGYCFYLHTNISGNFQICVSVPLIFAEVIDVIDVVLVLLLLTLNIFHKFVVYFKNRKRCLPLELVRNCLRDKFSRIFAKFAKLKPREKSTGSQFEKLNLCEKIFFSFFRVSKTYILH